MLVHNTGHPQQPTTTIKHTQSNSVYQLPTKTQIHPVHSILLLSSMNTETHHYIETSTATHYKIAIPTATGIKTLKRSLKETYFNLNIRKPVHHYTETLEVIHYTAENLIPNANSSAYSQQNILQQLAHVTLKHSQQLSLV